MPLLALDCATRSDNPHLRVAVSDDRVKKRRDSTAGVKGRIAARCQQVLMSPESIDRMNSQARLNELVPQ